MRTAPKNQSTDENRARIVSRLATGEKGHSLDAICGLGVELEHVVVHQGSGAAVPYAGPQGVCELLERLSPLYPGELRELGVPNGSLLGLTDTGHTVTLEPGSQIEISAAPMRRVAQVEAEYQLFRDRIDPLLTEMDVEFPMLGFHPTTAARDITLIPKFRYRCMGDYLGAISYLSQGMMRTSASLQVSIDYADEADAIRKLRDASAIGPLLYLITDNSPVYDGVWRNNRLVRSMLWDACDPDRCMVVPGTFEPGFSFASYADYMLSTPAILVPSTSEKIGWRYTAEEPIGSIYAENPMEPAELEHALSMFFPDVRLKGYVEIRQADALPLTLMLGYVALIKGLFYDEDNLVWMDSIASQCNEQTVPAMKSAITRDGYDAILPLVDASTEKPLTAAQVADALVAHAQTALDGEERAYLEPLAHLIAQRRSPADVWHNPYIQGPHGAHL